MGSKGKALTHALAGEFCHSSVSPLCTTCGGASLVAQYRAHDHWRVEEVQVVGDDDPGLQLVDTDVRLRVLLLPLDWVKMGA